MPKFGVVLGCRSPFASSYRLFHASSLSPSASRHPLFSHLDTFPRRHLGSNQQEIDAMLKVVGVTSLEALTDQTVPKNIRLKKTMDVGEGVGEHELLNQLHKMASSNKLLKSYIGMGYHNCIVPAVIQRNILENPLWYTQYTPYQPEIAQGRLESLLNFQTMVTELTGMSIANASLLDEGTAAAEAMLMCFSASKRLRKVFFVDSNVHPQTIACVKMRAEGFDIKVLVGDLSAFDFDANKGKLCGILIQYPASDGRVIDYEPYIKKAKAIDAQVVCATDLLALTLLKPPGEFDCDIALGNSQRFGVPLGFGGPHAAFFATKDAHKRRLPGRLVGVSKDSQGRKAFRLTLQTREQHIRREKATSNICTSQALLANMAAMYAVYHGPQGLKAIANRVHGMTVLLAEGIRSLGFSVPSRFFFDTITVTLENESAGQLMETAESRGFNFRSIDRSTIGISLDETVSRDDLLQVLEIFYRHHPSTKPSSPSKNSRFHLDLDLLYDQLNFDPVSPRHIPTELLRSSTFLTHSTFNSYHSETEMLRYITRLQSKDLSLAHTMIPLGSCTMKLNATTEMIPVSWKEFCNVHPFAPESQTQGYHKLLRELEYFLCEVTGFHAISLQPNSGAQGEYAGLRVIRAYLKSIGDESRNVCLIPLSAHGTNPASAHMAGLDVVSVKCDVDGNLDLKDLKEKLEVHGPRLAAIMITYPSTFGVFEENVAEVCEMVHQAGGQVYMDGANMNAQVGLCRPGDFGADVCHLNLHKTFCIPHGGGGPGMGPIGVRAHLAPFLPSHPIVACGGELGIGPISAAPFGSASILPISWAYIKMMGSQGLTKATQLAILNANYMARLLSPHYEILYTNGNGMCAHEFIVDTRVFSQSSGIEAIDVAKRLQDYGFHSPTMSWPVTNTLMIEPTESESKGELDRFCQAMISIRAEITEVEQGLQPRDNNLLSNAPHPLSILLAESWDRPYSRNRAAYPAPWLQSRGKFWPVMGRLDDVYGDRNLVFSNGLLTCVFRCVRAHLSTHMKINKINKLFHLPLTL